MPGPQDAGDQGRRPIGRGSDRGSQGRDQHHGCRTVAGEEPRRPTVTWPHTPSASRLLEGIRCRPGRRGSSLRPRNPRAGAAATAGGVSGTRVPSGRGLVPAARPGSGAPPGSGR